MLGGGFAGGYVARLLGSAGATIVSPRELHALHAVAPRGGLRHARAAPRRRAAASRCAPRPTSSWARRPPSTRRRARSTSSPRTARWTSPTRTSSSRSAPIARALPVPGLSRARARLQVPRRRDPPPQPRPARAGGRRGPSREPERHLTFVFIGAGYAGVEALAELSDLVRDALRYYPTLKEAPQRWVLVDAAPKILPEIPRRLGEYAARKLAGRGVDIRVSTTLDSVDADGCRPLRRDAAREPHGRLDGRGAPKPVPPARVSASRWTSGAASSSGPTLLVEGRENVWALGDNARVPNEATPGPPRPAHVPARPPPGPAAGEEPQGRVEAVPLPDARPGGDARAATRGSPTCSACTSAASSAGSSPGRTTCSSSRSSRESSAWSPTGRSALFFRRDIAELSMLGHPAPLAHPHEREKERAERRSAPRPLVVRPSGS